MDTLAFDAGVTFLAGENGSGKSTVLEAPERYFRHLSNERWTAHASRRGDAGGSTRCV